jgi:hypothetical protein
MRLRAGILPLFLGHIICAVIAMAFVSVLTCGAQIIYIGILYSAYMTLRNWVIWLYMVLVGFNCVTGWFSVWLYDGSTFYGYLIIILYYCLAVLKLYVDSRPYRNIGNPDGEDFYLEAGIRHILSNAR